MELSKEQKIENLNRVKKIAVGILEFMKQDVKLSIVDDGYSDPMLVIGSLGASMISDIIHIDRVGGTCEAVGFIVGYNQLLRGVRYYKDGSGEPDCEEFVETASTASQTSAAINLITVNFHLEVVSATDAWSEQALIKDILNDFQNSDEDGKVAPGK